MKKTALLIIIGLIFGGCQYNKVPDIQSKEYPRYSGAIPIMDDITFKYPTKEYKIKSTITTNGQRIEYTITHEKLKNNFDYVTSTKNSNLKIKTYNSSDIDSNLELNLNNMDFYIKCDNSINIENKKINYDICSFNRDKTSKLIQEELNRTNNKYIDILFKQLNKKQILNNLKLNNKIVKSGSILYKTMGMSKDILMSIIYNIHKKEKVLEKRIELISRSFKEMEKNLQYDVIVKGWGIYKNKRVIVTQFQQEIDMANIFYNMTKRINKDKAIKKFKNKSMFSKIIGYQFYDPNTFIKVYSKKVTYTNNNNKITKIEEISHILD